MSRAAPGAPPRIVYTLGVAGPWAALLLLLALAAAALFGLHGRFAGLGTWPFGVDEFYLSRSVDHVLASGVPRFPCGGYYTRGLLIQYLDAGLRLAGLAPELGARLIAALASLAALPAAFFVGRRLGGPLAGWLTVALLLASVWEIEMARFGRMYAPFQAIFLVYLLLYLRYVSAQRASTFAALLGVSLIGVLTWEGGTLLGLATLLAVAQGCPGGRLAGRDWLRLIVGVGMLALLYAASRDLRGPSGDDPAAAVETVVAAPDRLAVLRATLSSHRAWPLAFAIPLAAAGMATRSLRAYRSRPLALAAWAAALIAALAHAFLAVGGLLLAALLAGILTSEDFRQPWARRFCATLLVLLAYWAALELATHGSLLRLIDYPDLIGRIGWPWGRVMPIATAAIGTGVLYLIVRSLRDPAAQARTAAPARADGPDTGASHAIVPPAPEPLRGKGQARAAALALLVLLVLAVAAIPTERIETRYTFFLYPLLVALAFSAALDVLRRRAAAGSRAGALGVAAVLVPLACFALTEDFQPRHVLHIDSAAANFRLNMKPTRGDHYYPRNDVRGVGEWLAANVKPGDWVITGIPNLDPYYPRFDAFYLEDEDNRFDAYVCPDGRTDRWTGHPLVYRISALEPVIGSGHPVFAVLWADVEARLAQEARRRGWTVTTVFTAIDGKSDVLRIAARTAP